MSSTPRQSRTATVALRNGSSPRSRTLRASAPHRVRFGSGLLPRSRARSGRLSGRPPQRAGRRPERSARRGEENGPLGRPLTALVLPFEGLPPLIRLLFWVAFVLIVVGPRLDHRALRRIAACACTSARPRRRPASTSSSGCSSFPALNEELTIVDSVERLLAVEAANKAIVVIDDGSSDGTARVLAELDERRADGAPAHASRRAARARPRP